MQRQSLVHIRRVALALALVAVMFTLAGALPARAEPRAAFSAIDAKIEIVWPHGNAPVSQASLVNITAYLFEQNTLNSVPCDLGNPVRLWRALNNQPAQQVAVGERRTVTRGGVTFPAWDFNNVDVSAARDGANKYYFYVTVDGITTTFNIWSHGADARTYLPNPVQPTSVGNLGGAVDARIQVVWPHDEAGRQRPVNSATKANITVALFWQGTPQSVSPDFNQRVVLLRALNNSVVDTVGTGTRRIVRQGSLTYPVWDFNDVDVWAAQDPLSKYYFRVLVQDTQTFSTVWSHGVDARTYFPNPEQPRQGCAGQPTTEVNPQEVVQAFYTWYLSYPGNPLADRAYRSSPYLTPGFMQKLDGILASSQGGGYDPVLCAQDKPERFSTSLMNYQPPQALVGVTTSFQGHSFQVALNNTNGLWKISDVTCGQPAGVKTYTSQRLGLSFEYLSTQIGVQESGDRVYVYALTMKPSDGQWVQVFRKSPGTSLEDAIRAQVLQGYSPQDCFVVSGRDPVPGQTYPPTYQFARIDVPHSPDEGPGMLLPRAEKCPQPYTMVNGIAYFLADTAHPDRFLFFSIGQYPIPAGNGRVWQQTIRFLD